MLSNPITEPQIPGAIARDTETAAAIAAHVNVTDPHPIYLTQSEGDSRYKQTVLGIKEVLITGTVNSSGGDTGVLHGIPNGNVVGILCTIWDSERDWRVPPGLVGTGYDYFCYTTPTIFIIYVPPGTAGSSRVLGKQFRALLSYIS